MEEIKIKALVLRNSDYKEKDKIVTLFSLELGLVSVILKNCKSSGYKLKFAYNTFSFAEFELIKREELFFVKNATLIDNFFDLGEEIDRYYTASYIFEILFKCNKPLEPNQILFISTLKILNELAYEESETNLIFLKFLLGLTKVSGYRLNFKNCNSCGLNYVNKVYLNLETGEFECGSCKSNYSVEIEKDLFVLLSKINNTEIADIVNSEYNPYDHSKIIFSGIKLMLLNIENRFNVKLNCTKSFS